MNEQRLYGLNNEKKIIEYLKGKKFESLSSKWQEHIKNMFPTITSESVIMARSYPDNFSKPDIIIEVDGIEKYISIKTGKSPSVHHESYCSFRRFLERLHVSHRTLEIIRFFHYGESRKIKSITHPLTCEELKEKYSAYFLQASKELDKDYIINAVITRTIIRGTGHGRDIDFLYYGDLEHGKLLSVEDIKAIVLNNRQHGKTSIHFGDLAYMPNSRKVGSRDRNHVRIKWTILCFLYYCSDADVERMKNGTFDGKINVE